jgi:hypothetical protein
MIHGRLSISQLFFSLAFRTNFRWGATSIMGRRKGKRKFQKNPHAVALGRMGGSKGGKLRAAKLSPERRSEIARKAVQARWSKARAEKGE